MGFKRYNPDGYPSEYEPLHDPHLKKYIQRTRLKRNLRRNGLIACDACVKCTLKDFNSYRLYLNSVYLFYEEYGVSLKSFPVICFVPCFVSLCTLSSVQKIRMILGRSENAFHLLQWLFVGKQILKHLLLLQNNIAQLYFVSDLHWNFPSWLGDASDIYRFPAEHVLHSTSC